MQRAASTHTAAQRRDERRAAQPSPARRGAAGRMQAPVAVPNPLCTLCLSDKSSRMREAAASVSSRAAFLVRGFAAAALPASATSCDAC